MNKYSKRYQGSNTSPWIYWTVFAAILAYMVFKMVQCRNKVEQVQEAEKKSAVQTSKQQR